MRIVCLGSSSVEGIGDKKGLGWVGRLNQYLHETTPVNYHRVFNLGLMGDTIGQTHWRYNSEALPRNPNLVLIFTGTNDCQTEGLGDNPTRALSSPDKYMFEWRKFIKQLKQAGHKTVIIGPTKVNEAKSPMAVLKDYKVWFFNDTIKEYNENLKKFCQQQEMPFLELYDLFDEQTIANYTSDAVHPNDAGYDMIFEAVKSYLEENEYVK